MLVIDFIFFSNNKFIIAPSWSWKVKKKCSIYDGNTYWVTQRCRVFPIVIRRAAMSHIIMLNSPWLVIIKCLHFFDPTSFKRLGQKSLKPFFFVFFGRNDGIKISFRIGDAFSENWSLRRKNMFLVIPIK